MRGKGALDAPLRKLILHLSHRWETELAKNRSYDFVAAREIAARTGARVVIFGHTHHMARARLGGRAEYINSGTWTPLLSMPLEQDAARWVAEAREQKAYRTFNKPSFVRISEAGEAELLTWDESLSRPAPAGY